MPGQRLTGGNEHHVKLRLTPCRYQFKFKPRASDELIEFEARRLAAAAEIEGISDGGKISMQGVDLAILQREQAARSGWR